MPDVKIQADLFQYQKGARVTVQLLLLFQVKGFIFFLPISPVHNK